jgi:hypothetical protein
MRTWVCRARFAADRVFAIDRMKRAATLLGLRISSTGNSEGESFDRAGTPLTVGPEPRPADGHAPQHKTGPPSSDQFRGCAEIRRFVKTVAATEETDFTALLSLRLPLFGGRVDLGRAIQQGIKDSARKAMAVLFALELFDRIALGFFPGRRKSR